MCAESLAVGIRGASTSAKMATTTSAATMPTPTSAVALRRRRRIASVSGDTGRARGTAGTAPTGRSTAPSDPPLIGRCFILMGPVAPAMASSRVPDPRIEERVGQVDDQVDDDERESGDEGEALHLLVVAGNDRIDAKGAESRHGEERLHHDGATDEESDLEAHHGHRGNQGVLERVL